MNTLFYNAALWTQVCMTDMLFPRLFCESQESGSQVDTQHDPRALCLLLRVILLCLCAILFPDRQIALY